MSTRALLQGLVLLLPVFFDADAATVTWRTDSILLYLTNAPTELSRGPVTATLSSSAQHRVLPPIGSDGHWKLSVGGVNTSCLSWHALEYHIEAAVSSIASTVGRVSVVSSGDGYTADSSYGYVRELSFSNWTVGTGSLEVFHGPEHCGAVATWGRWEDPGSWEGNEFPTAGDDVVIPAGSGFVAMEKSQRVQSLTIESGTISTMESECPTGWSKPQAGSFTSSMPSKCWSVFGVGDSASGVAGPGKEQLNFADSQAMCRTMSQSSTANLVRPESWAEGELVKDLCIGTAQHSTNPALRFSSGLPLDADPVCWIGLMDPDGDRQWEWVNRETVVDQRWRSWLRGEPNNRMTDVGGEACAVVSQPRYDPEKQHLGLWNDDRCMTSRPFLCEQFAGSTAHTLTVEGSFDWQGGGFVGGGTVVVEGEASVASGFITDAARLELRGGSQWASDAKIIAGDGGVLVLNGTSTMGQGVELAVIEVGDMGGEKIYGLQTTVGGFRDGGFVLLTEPVQGTGRLPRLVNRGNLVIQSVVEVGWYVENTGVLSVEGSSVSQPANLTMSGGGVMMDGATVSLEGNQASLRLADAAVAMAVHPTFHFTVSAPLPVVDEERGNLGVDHNYPDRTDSMDNEDLGEAVGTYRLRVTLPLTLGGAVEVTRCIPYHADTKRLEEELNLLTTSQRLGRVSVVSQSGDRRSSEWHYGYNYWVVFDSAAALESSGLPESTLQVECQGSRGGCGCAEIVSEHRVNRDVQYFCSNGQNSSLTNPDYCTVSPSLFINRVAAGGQAEVSGSNGHLVVSGGKHRLPSQLNSTLVMEDGFAFISARNASVRRVQMQGGILSFGGASFEGLDNINLLDDDAQRYRRDGLVHRPITGVVDTLVVQGGELRLATNDFASGLVVEEMEWSGGSLAGWGSVEVGSALAINSAASMRMRAALRLICGQSCEWTWEGDGTVDAREGASMINQGTLTIQTSPGAEVGYRASREGWADPQQWSGVAWFTNPLCGPHCERAPYLLNRGTILIEQNSTFDIGLTVRHVGNVSVEGMLTLRGGGDGNGAWDVNGSLRLAGGRFVMDADSSVTSKGVVESAEGGPHQLADVLEPRLIVSGGVVESRSRFQELRNGLEVSGGRLEYTVSSSRVVLSNENFTITGGEVKFVEVLPNPGIHQSHIHTEPRNADRSFFTLNTRLFWYGGKLRGNCEIGARAGLDVGGADKRLEAMLHIVNYENMYWYSGDIILREQAGIVNSGTITIHEPETHTARMVNEFTEGHAQSLITLWEDNDGSVHQNLGGFA